MQCTNPHFLKDKHIWVPCGRCLGCRISHSREWTLRLLHEMSYWDACCFLTLTYDEEHCPISLKKADIQKFWKRLRKAIYPRKIKYFCCGEYGDTYGRPHYHAIVFGIDWNDDDIITECWPYGFHKIGGVSRKSCGYVTDYCLKKFGKKKEVKVYEEAGFTPPFQLCSQGLGLRFAFDNAQQLRDNLGCTLNGRHIGIPKYYVDKLGIDTDIMAEISKSARAEKISNICRRYFKNDYWVDDVSVFDIMLRSSTPNRYNTFMEKVYTQQALRYKAKERFKKGKF